MEEREVLKLARKTLALCNDHPWRSQVIAELDKLIEQKSNALAQPEQEPVACASLCVECTKRGDWVCAKAIPPQRKPWVSLSDEDIERIAKKARSKDHAITLAIRELKEKNT